jgi:hypothetical protein
MLELALMEPIIGFLIMPLIKLGEYKNESMDSRKRTQRAGS